MSSAGSAKRWSIGSPIITRKLRNIPFYLKCSLEKSGLVYREAPPQNGETFNEILDDVENLILPGDHPLAISKLLRLLPCECLRTFNFGRDAFGRFRCAGDVLDHQPRLHRAGDAVLDWLAEMLDLPDKFWSNTNRGRCDPG